MVSESSVVDWFGSPVPNINWSWLHTHQSVRLGSSSNHVISSYPWKSRAMMTCFELYPCSNGLYISVPVSLTLVHNTSQCDQYGHCGKLSAGVKMSVKFPFLGPVPLSMDVTTCRLDVTHVREMIIPMYRLWYDDMVYMDLYVQAPVPLSIFRSNSKFDENSKHSSVKYTRPITAIFCTRHDSITVVTCANYRCDWSNRFETRAFWILIEFRIRSKYA